MKEQLLDTVSHELRTPLTVILGYAKLLESGAMGTLTPEQLRCIQTIAHRSEALSEVITDMLDLSLIESGQYRSEAQPSRLDVLVTKGLNAVRPWLGNRSVHLDLPPDLPVVTLNGACLIKVLRHLLSNAAKHTPEDGRVSLRFRLQQEGLRVEVMDNGSGIPPECLPLLFKPFYQSDSGDCRKTGGTGIGLALCRSMLEANGGTIEVHSEVGRGTTFRFTLPVAVSDL